MNYCKSCYCVLGYNKYCVIHANGTLIRNTYNEKSEVFCSYVESCKTCTQTEYCMFYLGGYNVKSCGHLANSCSCGSSHTYKPTIK